MTDSTIVHGTFVVERDYPVAPAKVFAAFADPAVKRRWFGTPEDGNSAHIFEFRVGGREANSGKMPDGQDYAFEARYQDIVPDSRIVYSYEMSINHRRISVSVATIEVVAGGSGTHMTVTEMGAFLDGLDTPKIREGGTNWLMDQLGELLKNGA